MILSMISKFYIVDRCAGSFGTGLLAPRPVIR